MLLNHTYRLLILLLLLFLLGTSGLAAQTKQLLTWQQELAYLQTLSPEELNGQRDAIVQIRAGIELWLKLHQKSATKIPGAPPQPWNAGQNAVLVTALREVLASILKEDPSRPFEPGVTTVTVTAEASPLSPVSDTIVQEEIANRQALDEAAALDFLPGVAIDHVTANRNEAGIRIRGFSSRGQVPLYLDGIPVSMPYDATIDFNRFLTSDIAEIQVAKGYSSPLLGPNALGGSINLVRSRHFNMRYRF